MPRAFVALSLAVLAAGCASAPPIAPTPPAAVPFDIKMSWILRFEDARILRDPFAPVAPPPLMTTLSGARQTFVPSPPPPPDLIRLLTDSEARIRRRAALAVGRVGLIEAAPNLITVLRADSDPEVRQMAAFALGLLGDRTQPPITDALRQALADASPLVSGRAAEALGLIGDSASAADIGRMVAANIDAVVNFTPDSNVGHVGNVDSVDNQAPLDPPATAFRLGVYALAALKAYDPLAAAVLSADGQPRVQWWPVAYALARVEDKRALPALVALAKSEGASTRAFAARGLGGLKDRSAVPVLLPLVTGTRVFAEASAPAVEAIRALGQIGDPRAAQPLLAIVRAQAVNPMVRAEAILAASSVGVDTTEDLFVDLLADRSPVVRAAALQAFAKGDDDTFMTILSGLDPDPQWSVRAQLATTLATKDRDRALPRLTQMLKDPDTRVIPAVLTALTKLHAPGVANTLIQALNNDDFVVRTYAADNIAELKPDGAVEPLVAAFKRAQADAPYSARASALAALAKYGAAAAVPTLQAALADKDWAVRVRAAELLKTLDPSVDAVHAIRPAPSGRAVQYDTPSLVNPAVSPHVYFETDNGTVEIELDVLDAPLTCDNFVALVGKGYFEGLTIHRLVPDFVAQGGDPRGDSQGGPGYTIRDELNEEPYLSGTVGMAIDWRDTAGSQFFIAYGPQPQLDARYTMFGRVISGMDVVNKLAQGDVMRHVRVWDGTVGAP